MKIAFVLTDGFSNFEFAALFEPLARLRRDGLLPDLQWDLCALTDAVSDQNGMQVIPTCVRQPLSGYDLLAIPGGALSAADSASLVDWLKSTPNAPLLAASGSAALLLAAAGLLQGVVADGQAHAGVAGLARKERLKEARSLLRTQRRAVVHDHRHQLPVFHLRGDMHLTARAGGFAASPSR
jgi:cyclohexyl-isocyanide hydratase